MFGLLRELGAQEIVTEVDESNFASNALVATFDAHRIGGTLELLRLAHL
ncbi:hypothetical protein [Streptomyces alkaliphilus]|nr:hypothetical protein [Streptomyces alkaliphilus]